MQLELASLQNVAGFEEISSGQTSRIRADLRDWGQEWKNLGQKLRIWGRSEQLGVAHQGWGWYRSVHTKNAGQDFVCPKYLIEVPATFCRLESYLGTQDTRGYPWKLVKPQAVSCI